MIFKISKKKIRLNEGRLPGRPSTFSDPREIKRLKLLRANGLTHAEIVAEMGKGDETVVSRTLIKHSSPRLKIRPRKHPQEIHDKVHALFKEKQGTPGDVYTNIGNELGITKNSVAGILNRGKHGSKPKPTDVESVQNKRAGQISLGGSERLKQLLAKPLDESNQHLKSHSLDLDIKEVRQEINRALNAGISNALTPYIGIERARKILAPYSVFIPASGFMDENQGSKIFGVIQYDSISGMNNKGEVVTKTESLYHVYFTYDCYGGSYRCSCKLVTVDELDEIVEREYLQEASELAKRVIHHNITDAWDTLKRSGPNMPGASSGQKEMIKANLKQKGINVSDKDIDDAIEAHTALKKKLKKKLEEARLEELTAPTWKNTDAGRYMKEEVETEIVQLDESMVGKAVKALKRHFGDQKPKERMGKGYLTGGGKRREEAILNFETKFGHKPSDGMATDAIERWHGSAFKHAPGNTGDPAYEKSVKVAKSNYSKTLSKLK
jgi:hypothetical protein